MGSRTDGGGEVIVGGGGAGAAAVVAALSPAGAPCLHAAGGINGGAMDAAGGAHAPQPNRSGACEGSCVRASGPGTPVDIPMLRQTGPGMHGRAWHAAAGDPPVELAPHCELGWLLCQHRSGKPN